MIAWFDAATAAVGFISESLVSNARSNMSSKNASTSDLFFGIGMAWIVFASDRSENLKMIWNTVYFILILYYHQTYTTEWLYATSSNRIAACCLGSRLSDFDLLVLLVSCGKLLGALEQAIFFGLGFDLVIASKTW